METDYVIERARLFKEFGWEDNVFTSTLFEKAYDMGHCYGWGEVECHMHNMDDVYQSACKYFKGEK